MGTVGTVNLFSWIFIDLEVFWTRGLAGLWRPVAACGGLWRPAAACGTGVRTPLEELLRILLGIIRSSGLGMLGRTMMMRMMRVMDDRY